MWHCSGTRSGEIGPKTCPRGPLNREARANDEKQARPANDARKHAPKGVRMLTASCANCGRSADVNVDLLPETLTVPEAGQRLCCSSCGGKTISTRPAWHTGSQPPGVPDYRRDRPPMS
jgi:hypothetical protein